MDSSGRKLRPYCEIMAYFIFGLTMSELLRSEGRGSFFTHGSRAGECDEIRTLHDVLTST